MHPPKLLFIYDPHFKGKEITKALLDEGFKVEVYPNVRDVSESILSTFNGIIGICSCSDSHNRSNSHNASHNDSDSHNDIPLYDWYHQFQHSTDFHIPAILYLYPLQESAPPTVVLDERYEGKLPYPIDPTYIVAYIKTLLHANPRTAEITEHIWETQAVSPIYHELFASLLEYQISLQVLLNSTKDGILLMTVDGTIRIVNSVYAQFYKNEPEDLIHTNVYSWMTEKQVQERKPHIDRAIERGEHIHFLDESIPGKIYAVNVYPIWNEKKEIYLIAVYIQNVTQQAQFERKLKHIVLGISSNSTESFFISLVENLSNVMDAKYVYVGILDDSKTQMNTLAFWDGNHVTTDFVLNYDFSPCPKIVETQQPIYYEKHVQPEFPECSMLTSLSIEGFYGAPIFNYENEVTGVLVIMDSEPLFLNSSQEEILKIFTARTSSEIKLFEISQQLTVMAMFPHLNPFPVFRLTSAGTILTSNRAANYLFQLAEKRQIQSILPATNHLDLEDIITGSKQVMIEATIASRFYSFTFLGVREHGVCHVYGHDITEIKELKRKQLELFAAIEHSVDGITITNDQTKIDYINPAVEQLTGYSVLELMGQTFTEFLDLNNNPDTIKQMFEAIYEKTVWKGRLISRKKNGALWVQEVSLTPIYNQTDRGYRFIWILRDITHQIKIENEIVLAKENAERASQSKSAFLANMSHEIRTPMNGILGMLDFLKETELSYDQRELAEIAYNSAEALLRILNDVLDISKIEAGKIQIENAPSHIRTIANDVVHLFSVKAYEKNINMMLRYDKHIPNYIIIDAYRIRQILLNLVSNAVKFTDRGFILIDMLLLSEKTDQVSIYIDPISGLKATENALPTSIFLIHSKKVRFLQIKVEDSGVGIPPNQLDTIFEIFTQADSTHRRRHFGTGLGLAITKRLVELMNGAIRVESELGSGTIFTLTLPFEEVSPEDLVALGLKENSAHTAIAETVTDEENPFAKTPMDKPIRILVTEDDRINQKVLVRMISNPDLEIKLASIDVASTGKEAINLIRNNLYDIIFMDVHMPEMDGFEATKVIRDMGGVSASVPIIAVTANAMKGDRERCIQEGMNDHIPKPVSKKQLKIILHKWLRKRESNP